VVRDPVPPQLAGRLLRPDKRLVTEELTGCTPKFSQGANKK